MNCNLRKFLQQEAEFEKEIQSMIELLTPIQLKEIRETDEQQRLRLSFLKQVIMC